MLVNYYFDVLYNLTMALLVVRIIAAQVVLRFKLNVEHNATVGPKMDFGISVIQESDRERVIIPPNDGDWRTLCPIATAAAGVVVVSLAFFAWRKFKNHKNKKDDDEHLENVWKYQESAVAESRDLEEEEQLVTEIEETDSEVEMCQKLQEETLMEENELLYKKLEDAVSRIENMENLLKEKDDEKIKLRNDYNNQMEDMAHQIQDLLADEKELKTDRKILTEKLQDALSNNQHMNRLLRDEEVERTDIINYYFDQIEVKDRQIYHLLASEEELKKDHEILEGKLEEALGKIQDMERLLKDKKVETKYLTDLWFGESEGKDHQISDLLANDVKLRKDQEILEEQLGDAIGNIQDMERLLKEKEDEKAAFINLYDRQLEGKNHQIHDLLASEEKLKKVLETLEEKLGDALGNIGDMETLLKDKEDEKIELVNLYEKQSQDLLAEEVKWKKDYELLEKKLGNAVNSIEDMERLLKLKEEEKVELINLSDKQMEDKDHQMQDLLAKAEKLQKDKDLSKEKLGEALSNMENMEKLFEEKLWKQEDIKMEMEKRWELEILQKNQELDMWRQKCEEYNERQRHLVEEVVVQLENSLVTAKRNEETLKSKLNYAEEEAHHLRMTARENHLKIQELTKERELFKEKCRTLEESKTNAEKCAKEQQRMQEEALRLQDKYMLMGVLHRIAQRDYELERIAKEEHETTEAGKEKQETGSQDCGQEINQEFSNAQDDNRGYLKKHWLDVTDILEDILYKDERPPEEEKDKD